MARDNTPPSSESGPPASGRERDDAALAEAYVRGEVDPVDPGDDPSESGFLHAMEAGEEERAQRLLVRMAERAFHLWLDVCLEEDNQAFEKEDSPFADRETEVIEAIALDHEAPRIQRGDDLVPFLRRQGRDSRRIHARLEAWFLRQYDIRHSSAIIYHAIALGGLVLPFLLSVFFYGEAFTRGHAVAFGCIWLALAMVSAESLARSRITVRP